MEGWRFFAVVLGIAGTLLGIAAVAVFYGYIPASLVNNFTSGELGFFAALAIAGAIGCEAAGRR